MADRFGAIGVWAGAASVALVLALTLGTLVALLVWSGGDGGGLTALDWAAVWFTTWQAALSALLSVVLAVPVARALARRKFWGRGALVTLLGAPFILPAIVAVFGLLTVFGRAGWVSQVLEALGLPPLSIYGAHGVILAHVFFNLPLAVRFLLQAWLSVPSERFRLAASLGFDGRAMWRFVEWPLIRATLPGAFLVIFLLCLTSFAVALVLGGGPRATTIELAIYQAFHFEFDVGKAVRLALLQFGICALAAVASVWIATPTSLSDGGQGRLVERWDGASLALDGFWIGIAALFLAAPLLAIALAGAPYVFDLPASVWRAAFVSLQVALFATGLSVVMALTIAVGLGGRARGAMTGLSALGLSASPLVMGTGLFVVLQPWTSPQAWAFAITGVVNAVMVLPFALRVITPAVEAAEASFGPVADHLGLRGFARFRWLILPRIRRSVGFTAGLAAALSMGDLGVVALFADPTRATLPLEMFRLMGAYRMDDAAGAALFLFALSLALFWVFDRGGRVHDAA